MSIGEVLAAGRRQAGLTVTQVSERTRIRETIVRGIEHDEFSGCGGDFYARGHIRAIARVAGVDPEPLIREYDANQEPPEDEFAAAEFDPPPPMRFRERRRRPNPTIALLVVLAVIVGFVIYHFAAGGSGPAAAGGQPAAHRHARTHPAKAHPSASPKSSAPTAVVIGLTAASGSCWVNLTTSSGATIYQGILNPGATMSWTERQAVTLQLGNPQVVTLTIDGKTRSLGADPVTLDLSPGSATATSATTG